MLRKLRAMLVMLVLLVLQMLLMLLRRMWEAALARQATQLSKRRHRWQQHRWQRHLSGPRSCCRPVW
jgi:ABC-type Fe3+ transport system permease subunit